MIRHLQSVWGTALRYHQWIEYYADGRKGWAEPEAFIEFKDVLVLVECKLTGGLTGRLQMLWLYRPLLEHIFNKPVRSLLVCHGVTPETPGPFVNSLEEFISSGEEFGTWPLRII